MSSSPSTPLRASCSPITQNCVAEFRGASIRFFGMRTIEDFRAGRSAIVVWSMSDELRAAQPWLTIIGCVVVVGVLYLAQAVIVPVALAILMAFLLTPVVAF